jgi:hypothetical protein
MVFRRCIYSMSLLHAHAFGKARKRMQTSEAREDRLSS